MEIKKAFEQFKKEVKKELGIKYGFSMTAKQIKNRTATFCICNTIPYERQIEYSKEVDAKVQGYESWTDEEKRVSHERHLEEIARYEAELAQYGTKENLMKEVTTAIVNSKAFERFQQNIGGKVYWSNEEMDICYYIRFDY